MRCGTDAGYILKVSSRGAEISVYDPCASGAMRGERDPAKMDACLEVGSKQAGPFARATRSCPG